MQSARTNPSSDPARRYSLEEFIANFSPERDDKAEQSREKSPHDIAHAIVKDVLREMQQNLSNSK